MCRIDGIPEDISMNGQGHEQKLDLTALRGATVSLEGALGALAAVGDADALVAGLAVPALRETLMAGVVKNFEFVYELSTKMMRRFVQMEAEVPDEVSQWGFRDVLRHVADRGLIDDVQVWFDYRTMRGETGLAYMPEKARAVCESARTLLRDARALLAQLDLRAG